MWSLEHACNGWLAGLVSITACASVVDSTISLVIGALGGFIYCSASHVAARVAIVSWVCGERGHRWWTLHAEEEQLDEGSQASGFWVCVLTKHVFLLFVGCVHPSPLVSSPSLAVLHLPTHIHTFYYCLQVTQERCRRTPPS